MCRGAVGQLTPKRNRNHRVKRSQDRTRAPTVFARADPNSAIMYFSGFSVSCASRHAGASPSRKAATNLPAHLVYDFPSATAMLDVPAPSLALFAATGPLDSETLLGRSSFDAAAALEASTAA